MARVRPSKRLVIFCDGTWVGRETIVAGAPPSNIRMIANMIGEVKFKDSSKAENDPTIVHPIQTNQLNVTAGYQEGIGVGKTFLEYLWDGATASTIGDECVSVYKFIVENYTDDHEIWMFGFSRGAFTVRCVAGMINNCGILKRLHDFTNKDVDTLCHEVYRTYRSPLAIDHPKSPESKRFRADTSRVWPVKQPIRFMGLIDTVGALGIPRLNAGVGLDWPELDFFDQHASSVVQDVYHAPALHDRLWAFVPCLMLPGQNPKQVSDLESEDGEPIGPQARIKQVWFPGTHYDVGRQTFRFVRQAPSNWIEGVLGWLPDLLSRTVYPNQVLSDLVLRYLLKGIRDVDRESAGNMIKPNTIIPNIETRIADLNYRIAKPDPRSTGSGDIYGNIFDYGPGGAIVPLFKRLFTSVNSALNHIFPQLGDNIQDLLGIKTIIGILAATVDRKIPGNAADVYKYTSEETVIVDEQQVRFTIESLAGMKGKQETGESRYPSRTYESFQLWKRVYGQAWDRA